MHSARTPLSVLDGRNFATVPEAAAVLRCDPRTIRRRIAEGEIPAIRAGSQYRVPVAWLRNLASGDQP